MNAARPVVVIGCGDHSRVVVDLLRVRGIPTLGCIEPRSRSPAAGPWPRALGNLEHPDDWIGSRPNFIVAIGNNRERADGFDRCIALGLQPVSVIHPSAVILGGARIDAGAQMCAGVVVGVDARVASNAIINTAASVDHDNDIGPHASIAPGARLGGRVTIGLGAHVGIGATVREGITIGDWSFVAAGAVVVRAITAGQRVAGVPAEPMSSGTDP